jgi:hypothetical protein
MAVIVMAVQQVAVVAQVLQALVGQVIMVALEALVLHPRFLAHL